MKCFTLTFLVFIFAGPNSVMYKISLLAQCGISYILCCIQWKVYISITTTCTLRFYWFSSKYKEIDTEIYIKGNVSGINEEYTVLILFVLQSPDGYSCKALISSWDYDILILGIIGFVFLWTVGLVFICICDTLYEDQQGSSSHYLQHFCIVCDYGFQVYSLHTHRLLYVISTAEITQGFDTCSRLNTVGTWIIYSQGYNRNNWSSSICICHQHLVVIIQYILHYIILILGVACVIYYAVITCFRSLKGIYVLHSDFINIYHSYYCCWLLLQVFCFG